MQFYDFNVNDIRGNNVSMNQYKDKVILIVNIATECGFSYQLKGFQVLYENYQDKGFIILGFPSNSFKQEPTDNQAINTTCSTLFSVNFPLFEKIPVRGNDINPLFQWLITQKRGYMTKAIKFNYTKFLVDRNGNVVKRFAPHVKPEKIETYIQTLL